MKKRQNMKKRRKKKDYETKASTEKNKKERISCDNEA